MADDPRDLDSPGDWQPTGRRRSTFSPPPAGARYEPEPDSVTAGPPVASPSLSPQLHEGDRLDSDDIDEGDTEAIGFSPPPRRSLDDGELASQIERADTGTIDQIALLEQELQLREADARDFHSWEHAMLALGTPEALRAVEDARLVFTGVVPIVPSSNTPTSARQPEPGPRRAPQPDPDTGPGIDLPVAEDATVDAVLLDDREPTASHATVSEDFVVVDGSDDRGSAGPPPLVLPPEPRTESDLDRVLRARWLALDGQPEPLRPPLDRDGAGEGTVPAPGWHLPVADVHGLSDMRLVNVDTGGPARLPPAGQFPPGATAAAPGRQPDSPSDGHTRQGPRLFSLERGGVDPTPVEQRNGRAARLVWLWFGANGSALSVVVGALLLASGISLRQAIVAALIGIGLSFVPLGLGTLAGKRSGLPTMVVSRATFGLLGNVVPAVLAVLTRVFWGAAFLWLLGTTVIGVLADVLPDQHRPLAFLLSLAVGLLTSAAIAVFGFRLFERIQLVLSGISALVLVGFVALTARYVNLAAALTVQDGPWVRVVGGSVLVFSVVGLLWAQSTADLARYQRVQSSGARSMLWSSFGAGLPVFLLVVWGCVLAASNPAVAVGLVQTPFATLGSLLPGWYPVPLVIATVLPLISALTVCLYTGGLAMQSSGLRIARDVGVVGAALIVFGLALLLSYTVADMPTLLRDVATTIAVPVAAWTGIFCAEMMLRHRRFDARSLLQRGGVYPDYRWVNLVALVVATGLGFGLTSASPSFLDWQGYLLPLVGMRPDGALGQADVGVLVALGLGLVTPLLFGVRAVRRQEGGRQ